MMINLSSISQKENVSHSKLQTCTHENLSLNSLKKFPLRSLKPPFFRSTRVLEEYEKWDMFEKTE
jgi:hypothetical protein